MSKVDDYIQDINKQLYSPDEPFNSSIKKVENFMDDVTWNDLKTFIFDRIDILRELLEQEDDINQIRMLQGSIAELKHVLIMPGLMIEHIRTENENLKVEREIEEGENHGSKDN